MKDRKEEDRKGGLGKEEEVFRSTRSEQGRRKVRSWTKWKIKGDKTKRKERDKEKNGE